MNNEVKYSSQAILIIKNLKDFDKKEFEAWFYKNMVVMPDAVLQFLAYKENQKQSIVIPKTSVKM